MGDSGGAVSGDCGGLSRIGIDNVVVKEDG